MVSYQEPVTGFNTDKGRVTRVRVVIEGRYSHTRNLLHPWVCHTRLITVTLGTTLVSLQLRQKGRHTSTRHIKG